jgi:hypothetical protein
MRFQPARAAPMWLPLKLRRPGGTIPVRCQGAPCCTGWEHYADKWEKAAPDGRVLGTRKLFHPYVEEQAFTRSLGGVRTSRDLMQSLVRVHGNVDGYCLLPKSVRITPSFACLRKDELALG